jgi:hypothetical protein
MSRVLDSFAQRKEQQPVLLRLETEPGTQQVHLVHCLLSSGAVLTTSCLGLERPFFRMHFHAGRLSRGNVIGGLSLARKFQAHGTSVEEPQTSVASPVMCTKTVLRVLRNISDFARRNAGEADQ